MSDLLARARADGAISVPDTKIATQVLTGAITWSFVWYREGGRLEPEAFAESIVPLALAMVQARGPEANA